MGSFPVGLIMLCSSSSPLLCTETVIAFSLMVWSYKEGRVSESQLEYLLVALMRIGETHTHTHAHTYTHTHMHTHAHVHTCTHTCTHTYTRMHTHTHMHTHIHMHAHAHTHTHTTHAHTLQHIKLSDLGSL